MERVGPCPLCGGNDRLHVRPGRNGARVGCRGCIDGEPDTVRRERFGELLRAAFPDRFRRPGASQPVRPKRQNTPVSGQKPASKRVSPASEGSNTPKPATTALAGNLWQAAIPADRTPAHEYLTRRWVWPPPGGDCPDLPESVRWLPRLACGQVHGLPKAAGGLLLFVYRPVAGGAVQAVSVEGLQANGDRVDWRREAPTDPYPYLEGERWRRTYGSRKGAAFEAAAGTPGLPLVMCEGEVTALACRWLHPGCRVLACGGTSGLEAVAGAIPAGCAVILEVDGDGSGATKTLRVADRLRAAGRKVEIVWNRRGQDAADRLAWALAGWRGRWPGGVGAGRVASGPLGQALAGFGAGGMEGFPERGNA